MSQPVLYRLRSRRIAAIFLWFACMDGTAAVAQAPVSVEARTAAITRILADYREDQREREPELASLGGDKRFDDQLSDFSASAANARLAREQTCLQSLSQIDTTGLPEKTRTSAESLLNTLIEAQANDQAKTWQHPLDQFTRLHSQLLSIAAKLPFEDLKDYDDYIARLKKLPNALSQIMTNVQLASETGLLLPRAGIEKATAEVQEMTSQPAESDPLAAPLKRFPANIAAADRKRITTDLLDTLTNEVLPGYQRVGRFIAAHAPATPTS